HISEEASRKFAVILEKRLTRLFFPIRSVTYEAETQLEESHPCSRIIREETVRDREKFTGFMSLGGNLDASMHVQIWIREGRSYISWLQRCAY
ncbi:hypothetical protein AMATHDRAFT_148461, partial [Amanita thiersii Skay4041]